MLNMCKEFYFIIEKKRKLPAEQICKQVNDGRQSSTEPKEGLGLVGWGVGGEGVAIPISLEPPSPGV